MSEIGSQAMTDTTKPDPRQVAEPTPRTNALLAERESWGKTDHRLSCDEVLSNDVDCLADLARQLERELNAQLAANRELANEIEAHKAEHDISDGLLKDAETRALAAQKALRKASYSFERISKWREGALAYDRENNNPPRDFCEDVELIEESAKFSKAETDAALDAAAK